MTWERLEAAFIAPLRRATLDALELYHPLSGRHRFVCDEVDLLATLEDDAPADAGLEVEWIAAPLTINRPGQSDTNKAEFSISLDGVAGLMELELVKTRESNEPWILTARVYASDDTSGPAHLPPESLMLSSVKCVGAAVNLKADLSDSVNVNVPALTFKRLQYPTLQR
jgi:hypothetical protein